MNSIMILILLLTSMTSLFTPNLFMLWFFLEISSITFSVYLNLKKFKIYSILYFMISTVTSILLIFSFLNSNLNINYIIMISMWLKLSMYPFNTWMNFMMKKINYWMLFILLTIMKFIPIIIFLTFININFYLFMLLIFVSAPPVFLSLTTTSYPLLLNYSSMFNIPLILVMSYLAPTLMFNFFIIYMMSTGMIIFLLMYTNTYFKNSLNMNMNFKNNFFFNTMMIMYSQLPPFSAFTLKWNLIEIINSSNFIIFNMIIMMLSLIMTFNYLNFNNHSYFLSNYKIGHKINLYTPNKIFIILPFLSFFFIYMYMFMT